METSSCYRLSFFLFIGFSIFAICSWYPLKKIGLLGCPNPSFWCNSPKSPFISKPILHPLDPLTIQEVDRAREILSTYEPFKMSFPSIHSLSLDEPEKSNVLDWRKGDPLPPRKANVIALNGKTHLLIVDLDLGEVTSHVENHGSGYPMVTIQDIEVALQSIMARGVEFLDLTCVTPSPGWYGPDEEGRSLMKVHCFSSQGTPNFYMRPYVQPNMICVFERYAGDIGWRHTQLPFNGFEIRESRPKVTLVARMAASVGNYDYIFDWEFQTDGLDPCQGLSGLLMVKGTPYENVQQMPDQKAMTGPLVSENLVGAKREVAVREEDAKIKIKLYDPSEFHVVNTWRRSRLGNPTEYKVVPHGNAASLLDLHDPPPQMRAAFTNNQIWVTPYNRSEHWAGGLLVCQSRGEDNLAIIQDSSFTKIS
ncbi:hypothetical protein Pfo_010244 [Paulownia fortunei]|nr:hypothetical protein Pfo_010244 [Paulownia fortunei]